MYMTRILKSPRAPAKSFLRISVEEAAGDPDMFNVAKMTILAGAALFANSTTNTAKSYDRYVEVVNSAHLAIVSFYASNIGSDSWQADILGNAMLPPGKHVRINLDDGSSYCRFDLKTRFADGSSVIRHDVDVCSVTKFTLTDGSVRP
jgi:hypothetical protein